MSRQSELAALGRVADTSALSNRNLIINGAMQVAQRGTSITGISGDKYGSCDRFMVGVASLGSWTSSQETDAPDGFSNSYKLLCTTAKASPVTTNYVTCRQRIEAQNLQHLRWGTSNPSKLTASFWVKSNVTGTYTLSLENESNPNFNGRTYTIDTADTWEYKTLTYDGDSDGGINNDNGNGMELQFWLGSGSSFTSGTFTDGVWTSTSANRVPSSSVNLGSAVNNYWQVTGVQLEVGDTATPFEHRSYGEELERCKRYFQRFNATASSQYFLLTGAYGDGGNVCRAAWYLHPEMRSVPTFSTSGTISVNPDLGTIGGLVANGGTTTGLRLNLNHSSSATAGNVYMCFSSDAKLDFDAEL